jgi:adenylate cyclase
MLSPSLQEFRRKSALRLWQRFHIRLTALYGGLFFLVLGGMAAFFLEQGISNELAGVRRRLRLAAVATAAAIPPGEAARLMTPGDREAAEFRSLTTRLKRVADATPEISALSVLRRAETPGTFVFVADHVVSGSAPAAVPGQRYTAGAGRQIEQAFSGPLVDEKAYTDEWGTQLSGYAPIYDRGGQAVAVVVVDVLVQRLAELRRHLLLIAGGAMAVAALLLVLLSLVVGRAVQEPLAQIVDATTAIAAGDFTTRAGVKRHDEFGIVGRHFDAMASGLEEREFIKSTFGSYVSPQLVRKVLEERKGALEGQRRQVAVLFCDIRGFTSLSEKLPSDEVVRVLNGWLERATGVVVRRGGRVDKFIGDAVMAVWGSIEDDPDGAGHALAAAVELQQEIGAYNATLKGAPLAVGVGVNSGEAVAGSIGSARKLEFTVIGDTVNIASRFEGLCKLYGASVVAAGHVVKAATAPPPCRWLDRPIVQGRVEPLDLFEALPADDPRVARIPLWEKGAAALQAGRFAEARAAFAEASAGLEDKPAQFQLQRCDALIKDPPGPGWTLAAHRSK